MINYPIPQYQLTRNPYNQQGWTRVRSRPGGGHGSAWRMRDYGMMFVDAAEAFADMRAQRAGVTVRYWVKVERWPDWETT